jgi:hypothetical protein
MTEIDLHVPSAAEARGSDEALRALDHLCTERAVVRSVGAPESSAVELPAVSSYAFFFDVVGRTRFKPGASPNTKARRIARF